MMLVCYPWMSQDVYSINAQLFERFFIIILEKQINIFSSVAGRRIFRIPYKTSFEACLAYFVEILRLIQEQIKYFAFTRNIAIVTKETWITPFRFFSKTFNGNQFYTQHKFLFLNTKKNFLFFIMYHTLSLTDYLRRYMSVLIKFFSFYYVSLL